MAENVDLDDLDDLDDLVLSSRRSREQIKLQEKNRIYYIFLLGN